MTSAQYIGLLWGQPGREPTEIATSGYRRRPMPPWRVTAGEARFVGDDIVTRTFGEVLVRFDGIGPCQLSHAAVYANAEGGAALQILAFDRSLSIELGDRFDLRITAVDNG